jgi:hypothetical protein
MAILWVADPQGRRPAATFYPLDTPRRTPMLLKRHLFSLGFDSVFVWISDSASYKILRDEEKAEEVWRENGRRGGRRGDEDRDLMRTRGVWQGVAMDSLKFHPSPPCPTLLSPAGGPPLKRPYGRFRAGPTAGQAACSSLLPFWTPHAVRL